MREFIASKISKDKEVEIYPWNKWLRKPFITKEKMDEIFVFLNDIRIEKLSQDNTKIAQAYFLYSKNTEEKIKEIIFPEVKNKPVYFIMTEGKVENISLEFEDKTNEKVSYSGNLLDENSFTPAIIEEKNIYEKIPETFDFQINNFELKIINYKLWKNSTVSNNLISSEYFFKSSEYKIIDLELLDNVKLSDVNIEFEKSVIKKIKYNDFLKTDNLIFNNVNISAKTVKVNVNGLSIEPEVSNILNEPYNNAFEKSVLKSLEPEYNISADEKYKILSLLNSDERDVVNKLIDKENVSLNLPKLYNYQKCLIYALKVMFRMHKIAKVAVILDDSYFINKEIFETFVEKKWFEQLEILTPEFSFSDKISSSDEIIKSNNVLFFNKSTLSIVDNTILDIFDLVIGDNVDIPDHLSTRNVSSWIINDEKEDIDINLVKTNVDYDVKIEEGILEELEPIYESSKELIMDLIEIGNIFRINPEISKLYMEIDRLINRNSDYKRKSLIDILKFINHSNNRVIIYTQYENDGIKMLERYFKESNLNFLSVYNNESQSNITEKIRSFNSDKINLLLTNLKSLDQPDSNIIADYKINYDKFWNPVIASNNNIKAKYEINFNNISVFNTRLNYLIKMLNLDNANFVKLFDSKKSGLMFNENFWNIAFNEINGEQNFKNLNEFSGFIKSILRYFNFKIEKFGADSFNGCYNFTVDANNNKVLAKVFYNYEIIPDEVLTDLIELLKLDYDNILIFSNLPIPAKIKSVSNLIIFDKEPLDLLSKIIQ